MDTNESEDQRSRTWNLPTEQLCNKGIFLENARNGNLGAPLTTFIPILFFFGKYVIMNLMSKKKKALLQKACVLSSLPTEVEA